MGDGRWAWARPRPLRPPARPAGRAPPPRGPVRGAARPQRAQARVFLDPPRSVLHWPCWEDTRPKRGAAGGRGAGARRCTGAGRRAERGARAAGPRGRPCAARLTPRLTITGRTPHAWGRPTIVMVPVVCHATAVAGQRRALRRQGGRVRVPHSGATPDRSRRSFAIGVPTAVGRQSQATSHNRGAHPTCIVMVTKAARVRYAILVGRSVFGILSDSVVRGAGS